MSTPTITQGQIAIDPRTGVLYYKNNSGTLINTSLNWSQPTGSLIQTEDSVQINSDIIISGNLTVNGTTVTVSAETVVVEDNIMVLNSNTSNANVPNTFNSGIEIERGSSVNVQLRWNESIDKWQFTNDGVNYYDMGSVETASINDLSDVVLSNSSNGEYLRYNGSNWVNDVINLGADTAGDYVGNLTSGSGITITNSGGENSNPTIAVTANTFDAFGAAATAYANAVSYANSISGNTYANAVAYVDSRTLDNLFDVNVSTAANGDFLRYNGNTWINDPVNLSTDTVGNYVQSLVSGTGVFLSNNSGEGSTPTISIGQDVSISANVTFDTVTANFIGNITGNVSSISTHNIEELADVVITSAQNGQFLQYNGSAWVNNVLPISDHGSMTGLSDDDHTQYLTTNRHDAHDHTVALGTASINDLGDVTLSNSANGDFLRFNGSVWINDAVNLSTDTIGDYVANIVAGDAIEVSNTGGEGSSPTISVASGSIDGSHISSLFKYVEDVSAGNNIIINNQYIGSGQVGDFVIDTSATPSFDTVSANTITVNGYLIDPFGAQVDDVLKWNGTKFSPGIASTVAALGDLTDVSNTVPSVGDFLYWNGTTWTPSVPATGMPIVSDSAPASPIAGQLWFQSNTARTFIYYTDNSIPPDSQWVEVGTASSHPDLVVSKITQTIGNGANSYSIAHNLNTRNVLVEVYDNNTYETVTTSIARTTLDSITVSFAAPVSANAYTVVVIG